MKRIGKKNRRTLFWSMKKGVCDLFKFKGKHKNRQFPMVHLMDTIYQCYIDVPIWANVEIFTLGVLPLHFVEMCSYYFYEIFPFLYFIWFVFYFTYSSFFLRRISFFAFHIKANSYIQGNEYISRKLHMYLATGFYFAARALALFPPIASNIQKPFWISNIRLWEKWEMRAEFVRASKSIKYVHRLK